MRVFCPIQRPSWADARAAAIRAFRTRIKVAGRAVKRRDWLLLYAAYEGAPERLAKGLARYPIPIMLLARLGVDKRWQGQGVGKGLLRDALQRTLQAADIAGIRAFAVHSKDEQAKRFYERFDFIPSPTDPMHLFLFLKDVKRLLSA